MAPSKTFVYKKLPNGWPVPGEHLGTESREVDITTPPKGGLVLEVLYSSFDPFLRALMSETSIELDFPALSINDPISNDSVSKVIKSDNPAFKEGDFVKSFTPIAEYVRVEDPAASAVRKIENPYNLDLALFLGPLGMPGLTAWSSLHRIGKPKKGETIFVSSAAGAVGQIVGQIAKREGLKVIGSAGSDEKVNFLIKDLGFDAAFNYKKESPLAALKRLAPGGIDIYYDNVGGDHLEAALETLKQYGRIVACGMISDYNTPPEQRKGIKNMLNIVAMQITMQGFVITNPDFGPAYFKEHQEQMQKWLADGSIKAKLAITDGIDKAAEGFVGMMKGSNFGKAVLKVK